MTSAVAPIPCRTLAHPAALAGITLFTGAQATVTIRPSRSSDGILFRRIDLPSHPSIPANIAHVVPEAHRTVLSASPADTSAPTIQTVEHILSALAGCGITDALIDLDGTEIPILDGSSLPFTEMINATGTVTTPASVPRPIAFVTEPIVIVSGVSRIEAHPTLRPGLELTYHLEYPPEAHIPRQHASIFLPLGLPAPDYAAQVAPARTFSSESDARRARQMGLFTHLTPREMLVIGPDGPIDNAYRFDNEPARHKLLDLLGDLSLAARPMQARIIATRTGHAHNHAMAKALAAL